MTIRNPNNSPAIWAKHFPGVTYQGFAIEREGRGFFAGLTLYSHFRDRWRKGRADVGAGSQYGEGAFYKTEEAAVAALADEARQLRDDLNRALGEDPS